MIAIVGCDKSNTMSFIILIIAMVNELCKLKSVRQSDPCTVRKEKWRNRELL